MARESAYQNDGFSPMIEEKEDRNWNHLSLMETKIERRYLLRIHIDIQ